MQDAFRVRVERIDALRGDRHHGRHRSPEPAIERLAVRKRHHQSSAVSAPEP
jgi:hypothetical protein